MPSAEALSPQLTERVLQRLGYSRAPAPDLATLRQLLALYTRTVPWESASRIVRRAQHEETADCALMGAAFWESHFTFGTGGTCYESNYAFFGLLLRLGYEGYLTINDMGASIGCHSAIVILLDGLKHLVDVGLPLYAILPLREGLESTA
ncbi:MAG: arylamine N-acetyltransferase, partial [Chloroflexi bacterium]|nr:arylamine N-acetyltransferase [Chloroflexota bacterium]